MTAQELLDYCMAALTDSERDAMARKVQSEADQDLFNALKYRAKSKTFDDAITPLVLASAVRQRRRSPYISSRRIVADLLGFESADGAEEVLMRLADQEIEQGLRSLRTMAGANE
ncbi:MAG TPA: hypothetical protein PK159_14640 [Steroidobacteraceae bacterium]|nr:hypothetical protein [Steroidobacteraceae bacterium]